MNPEALTGEEEQAVLAAVKDANQGKNIESVTVDKTGKVTKVTFSDGSSLEGEAIKNLTGSALLEKKTGAEKFKEDNASILLKDENTVEKSDVKAIEKALSDYNDLSEEEQGKLNIEKSKLDAMKKKLEAPETKPSYSGGGGGGGSYTPASKVTSDRIAGSNRFDTAVKVSQSAYPDGAKTVILANGEKFSDVLAAMPYGKTIKAPILYTNFDNIPDETLKELKRLGVEKVILVGGEKSISLDEQKTLEGKGYKIDRINGVDRYETSKLIAERMKAAGAKGINDVIIASGQVFPDALSISPLAVENEIPILLTSKDTLSEYTIKSLDNVKDGKIYITGGVNSVSNSVESKLKEYTKQKITRFAGADRYETSQIIAKSLRPNATTSVFASGELFSDALVAGELVSKDNAPLMLVKKNNLPSSISNYVKDSKITNNVIVGGVNTVSDSVVSKIEELENR